MSKILLQLVPAAVACAHAPTAYPLCDGDGAPACGNIGQTGRPGGAVVSGRVHVVLASAAAPAPTGSLLAAGVNEGAPIARPLLDSHARPAPGNCAGKCSDRSRFSIEPDPFAPAVVQRKRAPVPAQLAGARIAAVGEGAVVVDEDSGNAILVDAQQRNVSYVAIGRSPGLVAYEPASQRAFVADRGGNQIVELRVGRELAIVRAWPTPVEPYGVALAPDGRTLLVTAVAARVVVAYDTATGDERWRAPTGPEPRGIAIAPDGKHAVIASLTGGVDHVDLVARSASPGGLPMPAERAVTFPRAAFAVTYAGDEPVVAFQRERPETDGLEVSHSYGGTASPIHPELALLGPHPRRAAVPVAQLPRALAWDGRRDTLYVAGLATDLVQEVVGDAGGRRIALTEAAEPRCGPSGLAVTTQHALLVWCAFTRKVARLDLGKDAHAHVGPQLVPSAMPPREHAGLIAFHASSPTLSAGGTLACASCHPEGRSDGLAWSVGNQRRKTPVLAGRVVGTAPFKWDGSDATLAASIMSTAKTSLLGSGPDAATLAQLTAYLEALPALATPARESKAVARGRAAFQQHCADCHSGPQLTDHARHELPGALPSDTPSLHGLAASAPYYHDGSAATLADVLRGGGTVHMSTPVPEAEIADLTAYLETL